MPSRSSRGKTNRGKLKGLPGLLARWFSSTGGGQELSEGAIRMAQKIIPKPKRGTAAVKIRKYISINTTKGSFEVDLFTGTAPFTVAHFLTLVQAGFYNGHRFYKIVADEYVQTGCPLGNGYGGCGYHIHAEPSALERKHEEGVLAMAHTNHALIGSQFYIVLNTNNTKHLDGNNPCFGKVSMGMSVVARLGSADQILSISYHEEEISDS